MYWNCCHIYYHSKAATHLLKLNMVLSVNLVCRQKHILSWVIWSEAPTTLVLHIIYGFPRRKMCSQSFPDITQLLMVSSHTLVLTFIIFMNHYQHCNTMLLPKFLFSRSTFLLDSWIKLDSQLKRPTVIFMVATWSVEIMWKSFPH